ncbi:aminopeptidase [Candidatus Formimonas warabiya]|uniref:Leucyl aminopeptidase n=1 Tax=Formimonas warabiya TaxID=1761012 RepID=A0A3G1L1A9_FORW1|nr:aminopeptidase [Candidatus Formimonas warabiya]ATW28438.1 leucyl aminopeptidase [Candidatus Formimonas warabiya]
MSFLYEYELGKAADVLVRELLKLKEGETFIITADTKSDKRVVDATARAAFSAGAKPMVIWTCTPPGTGAMTDDWLPSKALRGALLQADAWVEFNSMYLYYSETYHIVMKQNKNMRFLCLPGMHVDVFVRLFAQVDHQALAAFLIKVTEMTKKAKKVRLTTLMGEDVEFENHPEWPIGCDTGYAEVPGTYQMAGQIGWSPNFDTVNGVIVFDGSLVPQIGIVSQPVKVYVENGTITKFEGGKEAKEWENFMRSFNHPQMLRVSHVCYGFHPGAKLTGQIGEDERIWGCTQWGFGAVASDMVPPDGIPAPSHTDGVTLNTSVWLDGQQITDNGRLVDPELIELAKKLGMK